MRGLRRGRIAAGLAGLLVVLAVLPGTAAGAGGSGGSGGPGGVSITLASQTTWLTDRAPFEMRVHVQGGSELSGLEIQVAVFPLLRSRSAFSASQRARDLGGALWSESSPIDQLGGTNSTYPLCVPVDAPPPAGCDAAGPLYLEGVAGVYPVVVTLRKEGSNSFLDQLVTHLVLVPGQPSPGRLALALVVPVAAATPLQPNGSRQLDEATVARLGGTADLLGQHLGVPLTLAPDPATLAALADTGAAGARNTLAELRRAAATDQVLAMPFAPAAPYDLVGSGLSGEVGAQLDRGGDVVRTELGVHPDPATWLMAGPLDGPTLDALKGVGVSQLVVSADELQPTFSNLTPAQPYSVDVDGTRIPAVGQDPALDNDLAAGTDQAGADPVLAGHELLADLAQTFFEAPNSSEPRALVAVAPRLWAPSRRTLSVIMDGLADSPILSATTLADMFAGVPAARSLRQAAFAGRRPLLPASRIRSDRADQAALAGSAAALLPAAVSMNDLVLESEAAGLSRSRREAYLDGAEQALANQLKMVSIVNSSVTLTSRQATIPISVQSRLPVAVAVRVTLASDQLEFTNGRDTLSEGVQTLRQQNTTILVPVTARSTGSFALRVSVLTANGGLTLASARLTVNSRVFSGVGIGLSAGALAFLALWWGRELRKGRRRRRDPDPVAAPAPRPREPAGART